VRGFSLDISRPWISLSQYDRCRSLLRCCDAQLVAVVAVAAVAMVTAAAARRLMHHHTGGFAVIPRPGSGV